MITVEAENLRKGFRSRDGRVILAVDDVSFTLQSGETVVLLGPNGAGKTTTVKMLCGLITPTAGRVRLMGHDLAQARTRALASVGAVLEGNRNIYWRLSVEENLAYFAALRGASWRGLGRRIDRLLQLLDLQERRHQLVQSLSRGMQQKVALACALVSDPAILLLDEPTLGLDFESSQAIISEVRCLAQEEGRTILLTTHQMEVAEQLADRVAILDRGQLVVLEALTQLKLLFAKQHYVLRIAGALDPATEAALTRDKRFLLQIQREDGQTTLSLVAEDPSQLYVLLQALSETGLPLLAVERPQPNLAEIYRRVLQEGGKPNALRPAYLG